MATLYLTEQGSALVKESQRLVVRKGDDVLASVPIIKVDQVVVFGNVSLTTPAMSLLMGRDVDVVFLAQDGRYKGRMTGPGTGNGVLRQAQYRQSVDARFALRTGKAIVRAKLLNQRALLSWAARVFGPTEALADASRQIEAAEAPVRAALALNALMGIEGAAAAAYFRALKSLLRHELGIERRQRRPPPDPVNAMLSFGYTLLTNHVRSLVEMVGLDLFVGFLHNQKYNRPSMALDLVEAFRAPVVDWVVVRAVNRRDLTAKDFNAGKDEEGRSTCLLSDDGRARFIGLYETRLATKVVHPRSGNAETFRRCLELDTRAMARAIMERSAFTPFVLDG